MFAHLGHFGHRGDHALAEVVGVRTGVTHATNAVHRGHSAQQVGEIVRAVVVRIDGLPQQHHFAQALRHHLARFAHHVVELTAAFFAARVRHDAIRAAIIAAALHGNPRLHPVKSLGDHIFIVFFEVEVGGDESFARARAIEELRQCTIAVGPNHQRHVFG